MPRKAVALLLILAAWLLLPPRAARAACVDEGIEIDRLVGLCRLWGHVKYFHPGLAYRQEVDWDAALVAAIPKVMAARERAAYRAALQEMLDLLADPLTRVDAEPAPNEGDDRRLELAREPDGLLVVTAGDYFALSSPESQKRLEAIAGEIPRARAVVFDLRTSRPPSAFGDFQLVANFDRLVRLVLAKTLTTPGERRRRHIGFASDSVFSSGQYRSGFWVEDGKRIVPAQGARRVPVVFVSNENSATMPAMAALQAAGQALVVRTGGVEASGSTESVDVGDGLRATVRVGEPILEDGTSGEVRPDAVVAAGDGATDEPRATALRLARNFEPSSVVRPSLPAAAAPSRDRSYSEMAFPSLEYRLLAAFRIWNVFHYFFPYSSLMDGDWEAVLRAQIPKFVRAKNALDYSLAVAEMVTHVHDSHAYVSGTTINEQFGTGYPPVRVRIVEGLPVVVSFRDEVARASGLEIGDVVLKVDGEEAMARLARYAKYISASTPQSNLDKAALSFMNGEPGTVVTLVVRGRDGEKEVRLERRFEDYTTLYHRERSGDVVRMLPGGIGYVDLDRLSMDEVDATIDRLQGAPAIVFDMRGYPNDTVWTLAPRLTRKHEITGALIKTPIVGAGLPTGSFQSFLQTIPGSGARVYEGRTVMLIDERTMSQAEHTGLFLAAANGTVFVGSPTAGANGEITTFSVPGGIGIGFSGQSVRHPDGRQLQRIGLLPDVEARPTIEGVRAGRDEVLDAAVVYLRRGLE